MLQYLIQTSIFRYSKNYGSLTHETRIKDAVNMGDLICLLATVRTLKVSFSILTIFITFSVFNSVKLIILKREHFNSLLNVAKLSISKLDCFATMAQTW